MTAARTNEELVQAILDNALVMVNAANAIKGWRTAAGLALDALERNDVGAAQHVLRTVTAAYDEAEASR